VVEFEPGETIPTDDHFYIDYKGLIRLKVLQDGIFKVDRKLRSGEMFDLKFLGLFSKNSVFLDNDIKCTSITKTKLFRWSKSDLEKISNHNFAKEVWQSLLINNLSFVVESFMETDRERKLYEMKCDEIFSPLAPWEQPRQELAGSGSALRNPLLHLTRYIRRFVSLQWPFGRPPAGIRQTQLPPPPPRPNPIPQAPPRFHRLMSANTGNGFHLRQFVGSLSDSNINSKKSELTGDLEAGRGQVAKDELTSCPL
jgi:hypothetical protein